MVWVHCASLGEFEQARPVIEQLKADYTNVRIVLTFFSPSGYEVRKNYKHADLVLYLPLDSQANALAFISHIKPDLALFVKYEFWYHYLHALKQQRIPAILFSSTFRAQQIFFKPYGGLYRYMLQCFSKIYVQNDTSAQLLKGISIAAETAPDTRFDRVITIAEGHNKYPLIEQFKGSAQVLIAGSTWAKDEALLLQHINTHTLPGYKYIIAPHNIIPTDIDKLCRQINGAVKWSELTEANAAAARVLIIDNIGHLAHIYAYSNIVYVGGGFNTSVHNILEPAVYGVPLIFGPNHHKANEALDLLQLNAAYTVNNSAELQNILQALTANNNALLHTAGAEAKKYVYSHKGGTQQIMQYLHGLLHA